MKKLSKTQQLYNFCLRNYGTQIFTTRDLLKAVELPLTDDELNF